MKKKLLLGISVLGLAGIISFFSPVVSNASENTFLNTNNGISTVAVVKDFGGMSAVLTNRYDTLDDDCILDEYDNPIRLENSSPSDDRIFLETKYSSPSLTAGLYKFINQYSFDNDHIINFYNRNGRLIDHYVYSQITGLNNFNIDEYTFYIPEDFYLIMQFTSTGYDERDIPLIIEKYKVLDVKAPTIGGTIHTSVNVDNQPSLQEILSHVYAYDETDGYVTVNITNSTYVQNAKEVGDYVINISASDKSGNTTTGVINVHRYDETSPTINGKENYDLNYSDDLTLSQIESELLVEDNVDSKLVLEKVSDTYSGNEHKVGNYQVVYRTHDNSGNYSANKTINISIKNKGTAVISGASEITIGTNQILSLGEFKNKISVVDGYDGTITNYEINGFDEYTNSSKIVGTNIITVRYTNTGGNTAEAQIKIIKKDMLSPTILFDNYFVLLKQGEQFTMAQFIEQASVILSISIDDIVEVKGEYDTNKAGEYSMTLCLANNEEKEVSLVVGELKSQTPNKWSFKSFFSTNMDNWTDFSQWKAWSIITWLSWCGIGLGVLVVLRMILSIIKKRK